MKKLLIVFLVLFLAFGFYGNAQNTITGSFPALAGQQVRLVGFNGFSIYTVSSTRVSDAGNFKLTYNPTDFGMGYLAAEDNKPYFVVLDNEDLILAGELLSIAQSVEILEGEQNQIFARYATEHPRREQALSAWVYLERIYNLDSLFLVHNEPRLAIETEKQRIHNEDKAFLSNLNPDSYLFWYLPTRKLISSVSAIAQFRTDEIPAAIAAFRALDHTDNKLYKSGLMKDAIESHFWLLENSGRSLDSVFIEMNISIDHLVENLVADERKLNLITDFLFDLLERRSLFGSSEYLALKLLSETGCTLDDNLARQLETYRAMRKGNTAPDIVFADNLLAPGYSTKPKRLSDLDSKYTLVVFGGNWCPKCRDEMKEISNHYTKWKGQGVEVVYVSLDDDINSFKTFADNFPFVSTSDFKRWQSQPVLDYYVFATPTMFLLDSKREILLRPNSVRQMDAWVDWFLVEGRL